MPTEPFEVTIDWAGRNLVSIALGLVAALVILIVGRWLAKLAVRLALRWMKRADVDETVSRFAEVLLYAVLMVAVAIAALNAAGVHTTSFTAILAAAAVAIGLALRDSLSNFASGVLILLFKPYGVDDFVAVDSVDGTVESVSMFTTTLRTPDNIQIHVPNANITSQPIKNYTAFTERRVDLVVGIGYDDSVGRARDVLMALMTGHPLVLVEPAPTVEVISLGESSIDLAVRAWTRTEDNWRVRCDLLEAIPVQLEAAGVGIPYPQRDVWVRQEHRGAADLSELPLAE